MWMRFQSLITRATLTRRAFASGTARNSGQLVRFGSVCDEWLAWACPAACRLMARRRGAGRQSVAGPRVAGRACEIWRPAAARKAPAPPTASGRRASPVIRTLVPPCPCSASQVGFRATFSLTFILNFLVVAAALKHK